MDDRKLDEIKNRLMADIDLPDQEKKIYRNILDCCLKEEEINEKYLSIKISNSEGNLKKYRLNFNLNTALTLARTANELAEGGMDMQQLVFNLLGIIVNLFRQESVRLDSAQVVILIELYENQRHRKRDFMEEDLYERVRKNEGNHIDKITFTQALEKLRKLKCIEVTQGIVRLVEKVEVKY